MIRLLIEYGACPIATTISKSEVKKLRRKRENIIF